jgi:hypothetical protein
VKKANLTETTHTAFEIRAFEIRALVPSGLFATFGMALRRTVAQMEMTWKLATKFVAWVVSRGAKRG